MTKQNHTTSIRNNYTSDSRDVLNDVQMILAEHYGIKIASLVKFTRSLNKHLPADKKISDQDIARALYGESGKRQQINSLLKKYGGAK